MRCRETQPRLSRHLAQSRELGAVLDRRQGQWNYYRMNPALPAWAREVLAATAGAVSLQDSFSQDLRALQDMQGRPQGACCS